jgi:hypothetical protein
MKDSRVIQVYSESRAQFKCTSLFVAALNDSTVPHTLPGLGPQADLYYRLTTPDEDRSESEVRV